jgi:uncharacterized membrane protein
VGVRSADSAATRAALAVRELERAGGFDRKVLVVWVPTGTGWMIPKAAAALEQLHGGNTAIIAIQYSLLPSWLAAFVDAGLANEAGTILFNAVRARWSELPPNGGRSSFCSARASGLPAWKRPSWGSMPRHPCPTW